MSKHVGRKDRWAQRNAKTYVSELGPVEYRRGAWYTRLLYRVRAESPDGGLRAWVASDRWLGPYKRPRDAMVALEREVTVLRNRHAHEFEVGLGKSQRAG